MSRLKKFTQGLLSSYALLGVNVLYTLAAVPLALKYLSKAEFGLWALTLQIAGYVSLIDLGMGSSISRILIDHKDDRANGSYGSAIQSAFLVGLAQGIITLAVGLSIVWFLAAWLRVPLELSKAFLWLMIGQVCLTAMTFVSRLFSQLLYAWQRIDVTNYSGIAQFFAGFSVLWLCFVLSFGVYSLLLGTLASWVCSVCFNAIACVKLGFWPKAGEWGRASRRQFRELFSYGTEVFLITIGTQVITSSQTLLVTRELGIEAAAVWSVMTRMFTLVSQIVWKIVGNAMPAFAEMQVRREWEILWRRYRGLFITANVFAGVCGVLFAACNGPFVRVWTHQRFFWPQIDNVLLALWLIVLTQQCCHNSLIVCLKEIRGLKYLYLIEGVVFVGLAIPILPSTGLTGMLICSVAATITFTWLSGVWRVAHLSGKGWKPLLWDWQMPLFWVVGIMGSCWLAIEWMVQSFPDWLRLLANGCLLSIIGVWVSLRFALPSDLIAEVSGKFPPVLQRAVAVFSKAPAGRNPRLAKAPSPHEPHP
jgi:O-antigen/teichoic acid export membrane protein